MNVVCTIDLDDTYACVFSPSQQKTYMYALCPRRGWCGSVVGSPGHCGSPSPRRPSGDGLVQARSKASPRVARTCVTITRKHDAHKEFLPGFYWLYSKRITDPLLFLQNKKKTHNTMWRDDESGLISFPSSSAALFPT